MNKKRSAAVKAGWDAMSRERRLARAAAVKASWAALSLEQRRARTSNARKASRAPSAIAKMRKAKTGRPLPQLSQVCRARFLGRPKSESQREKIAHGVAASMERRGHVFWQTSIEKAVAAMLTALGIRFCAQKRVGRYVVDFVVPDKMLAIECDGEYWHSRPGMVEKDRAKDIALKAAGFAVLRLAGRGIADGSAADVLREAVA